MTAVTIGTPPSIGPTTIVDIVAKFANCSVRSEHTRRRLRAAFGMLGKDNAVTSYLTTILQLVHEDTIDVEVAASDIWETAVAAQSGNPDLEYLLDIGVE